jgi:PAS domain S-box-containing protein
MKAPTKILILEDNEMDAALIKMLLKKNYIDFESKDAANRDEYILALDEFIPDVILSDNTLPQFSATEALEIRKEKLPHVPFILVTGTVSEEFAAGIIKLGADDYILKDRLARLPAAIDASLKHRQAQKEKHEVRKILKKSEENYRTIMQRVSDGFVALDRDLHFTYVNGKACEILNKVPEDLIGKSLVEAFPTIVKHYFFKDFISAFERQQHIHSDGYYPDFKIWMETHIYPSHDGVSIFFKDITEKKKAEREKEFDHNNMHALINNTHDLVWSVDRNYNLITSNEAFDRLVKILSGDTPIKGANILSKGFSDKQKEHYRLLYERAFLGESFSQIEHETEPDEFWSEISYFPIYEGKSVVGTACFSRNITDRIRAEEEVKLNFEEKQALAQRLSAIINTLPANIALLDTNGVIIDVNDAWRNFAKGNGFIGNNYAIGDNYLEITKKARGHEAADGQKVARGIRDVLNDTLNVFEFEYSCHSPETNRWFRMVVSPLREKEYTGAVVMHVDISELRKLEQERLHNRIREQKKITQAMLQAQEKERNYIGQELHDNINQILAGTKLYLGAAANKDKAVKELVKYPMELIDSSIDEIRMLCHRLVTPIKNIDLEELVKDLVVALGHGTNLKTQLDFSLSKDALRDELKLGIYRIIQEQTNNILKYAKAENVSISLKEENKKVYIEIKDDGKGFDVEKKRDGIGISNMINRVEFFNGEIELESSVGNGCKVKIEIPF